MVGDDSPIAPLGILVTSIDEVFQPWSRTGSPGCVCAISDAQRVIFERAYGMADLERNIPLNPDSVFYVASVSKQFVAASVALLSQREAFSMNDDAREYLSQLHGLSVPVSIQQLAQHTSGLRDYFGLWRLAGHHELDYLDNDLVLRLMSRQRTLEFEPGSRYQYSNSNYVLLAELVSQVSGLSVVEFSQREIFEPLGMQHTRFEDDHRRIVPGRVTSYQLADHSYQRFVKEFDVIGDGGLISTAGDLTAWGRNLLSPKIGGQNLVDMMTRPGRLQDGSPLKYGLGLRLGNFRDQPVVGHTGSFKGFRARLMVLPNQQLSIAVLCNVAESNPTRLSEQLADLFIGRQAVKVAAKTPIGTTIPDPPSDDQPVILSSTQLDALAGHYWSEQEMSARHIYVKDGTLYYGRGGKDSRLEALSPTRFEMPGFGIPISFDFSIDEMGRRQVRMQIATFQTIDYLEYAPAKPDRADLQGLAGRYLNREIDAIYTIREQDGELQLEMASGNTLALIPRMANVLQASEGEHEHTLRLLRDQQGSISGFSIDSGWIHGLDFERLTDI
jgi:CubicO group peptidase (beta-lactamase class C family)